MREVGLRNGRWIPRVSDARIRRATVDAIATAKRVAPAPSSVTVPARSLPRISGIR